MGNLCSAPSGTKIDSQLALEMLQDSKPIKGIESSISKKKGTMKNIN